MLAQWAHRKPNEAGAPPCECSCRLGDRRPHAGRCSGVMGDSRSGISSSCSGVRESTSIASIGCRRRRVGAITATTGPGLRGLLRRAVGESRDTAQWRAMACVGGGANACPGQGPEAPNAPPGQGQEAPKRALAKGRRPRARCGIFPHIVRSSASSKSQLGGGPNPLRSLPSSAEVAAPSSLSPFSLGMAARVAHERCRAMARDGARERALACDGTGWHAKACGGTRWHAMARNGAQRHAMACDGTRWHAMARDGTQRHATARKDTRWHAMARYGARWPQSAEAPNAPLAKGRAPSRALAAPKRTPARAQNPRSPPRRQGYLPRWQQGRPPAPSRSPVRSPLGPASSAPEPAQGAGP